MKHLITLLLLMTISLETAMAGGSIEWEIVRARIGKTDPELVKIIEKTFTVNRSGGGVRLGPSFGERHGERIAPYEFEAVDKTTGKKCLLVMEESDDYHFTGRFKFMQQELEPESQVPQPGTGSPSIRPMADKTDGGKPNEKTSQSGKR